MRSSGLQLLETLSQPVVDIRAAATVPAPSRAETPLRRITRWIVLALVGSYCLIWPRVLVAGVVVPVQRVLVLIATTAMVAVLVGRLMHAERDAVPLLGRVARILVALAALLVAVLVAGYFTHVSVPSFNVLAWTMDSIKYVACVSTLFVVYFALRLRIVRLSQIVGAVVASSLACIAIAYGCLVGYLVGFRSLDDSVLRSFGGALGVWPTDGVLPRLVSTSSEPQQLSVLFVTGLLLMVLSRRRLLWLAAVAGLGVLLLSQSKFALASALVVGIVAVVVLGTRAGLRRRGWAVVISAGVAVLGGVAAVLAQLPIFAQTLREGTSAVAVTERVQNAGVLSELVSTHFWQGIGGGQFGIYRGELLGLPPDPWYYPNNDYMKVFAELGTFGFIAVVALLGIIVVAFVVRLIQRRTGRTAVVFALGSMLILANMAIGYEMLHVFLWMNLGVLVFLIDHERTIEP